MIVKVFSTINLVIMGMCVKFRLQGDHEQIILTNYDPANPAQINEISATNTEIYIWEQKDAKSTRNNTIHVR